MINMETQKQVPAIDLRLTLIDAAQCFHWVETERGFGAVLGVGVGFGVVSCEW